MVKRLPDGWHFYKLKKLETKQMAKKIEPSDVKNFEPQSKDSFVNYDFTLSPTVRAAFDRLTKKYGTMPISAAVFAREILQHHNDYVKGKATALLLKDTDLKKLAQEWLYAISSLFDKDRLGKDKKFGPLVLHGRLVIVGMGLIDVDLRSQFKQDGVFDALISEIREPLAEMFTEHGRELLLTSSKVSTDDDPRQTSSSEPFDSVPAQPDNPVHLIQKDQLGRAAFARYLVKRIVSVPIESGAYSIHLYGPWGSGKSTLLNFLKAELEGEGNWLVVEFNAWRHQHIRPPWWSLMENLFNVSKAKLRWWHRVREYWWRFNTGRTHYLIASIVLAWIMALALGNAKPANESLKFLAALAENVSKIIAVIVTIWGIVTAWSRSLLLGSAKAAQNYIELTHDPMNEIKERFTTLMARLNPKRVAVFIDDLDRCQSSYAIELLEGIQTLFCEAPVIFLVAADRRWLNACYEESYDKIKLFVCEPGKQLGTLFLEKAFQFTTPVPGIPKELKEAYWQNLIQVKVPGSDDELSEAKRVAKERMSEALTEGAVINLIENSRGSSFLEQRAIREEAVVRLAAPDIIERTEHALRPFASFLEPNPRSMKRLVNAYSVNRALATLSHIRIERDQLVLWTILSLRWPRLADLIEDNSEIMRQIAQGNVKGFSKDLDDLCKAEDVIKIIKGGPQQVPLTTDTVQACRLLRC